MEGAEAPCQKRRRVKALLHCFIFADRKPQVFAREPYSPVSGKCQGFLVEGKRRAGSEVALMISTLLIPSLSFFL